MCADHVKNEEEAGCESPVVKALDRDLGAVLQRADSLLFVFLGIALAAAYLPRYVRMPAVVESILLVFSGLCIVGGIGFTIHSSIRGKRRVATRYGLACPTCGFRPRTNDAFRAAQLGVCSGCGAVLKVRGS